MTYVLFKTAHFVVVNIDICVHLNGYATKNESNILGAFDHPPGW